jgi:ubiquinone/menaquinone biosynthesis C-methylase UbiE/uncharacterized protein YbaR (Trm112 family)
MKRDLLTVLSCPNCLCELALKADSEHDGEIETGILTCIKCAKTFPVVRHVPRFVSKDNYSSSFGLQWNQFRKTQLDSYSGHPISRKRFFEFTGWDAAELKGKLVLDVGCGAGRFAEIALSCGAHVVAVDYSSAVDACWENHRDKPGFQIVQADIYHLPFRPEQFDFVYCLGVLQHTPDVKASFMALNQQVRPGGRLAVDVYPKLLRNIFWSKYWIRPLTKRISSTKLFSIVRLMVMILFPISSIIIRIPLIGNKLKYGIPIVNYTGVLPLSPEQQKEWSLLDTYDMLSPAHDHPQSASTLNQWLQEAGLQNRAVFRTGFFVGRGEKPLRLR